MSGYTILFLIITFILIWIIYRIIYNDIQKQKALKIFNDIFTLPEIVLPNIKKGMQYGYPTYNISFRDKKDFDFAEKNGLFEKFEDKIQSIHSDIKNFDVKAAVYFNYTPS